MSEQVEVKRLAAMADLHFSTQPENLSHQVDDLRELLDYASQHADVLLLCGDLTDHGRPEEAHALARHLAAARTPIIAVLGNHDHEAGVPDEVATILAEAGVRVLAGESCVVGGVGFAGVKGFGGGFGRRALAAWGEPAIKRFVQEVIDETLKLEAALVRLDTPHRVVLLHYAPIEATVEGEPREILPFLGSSHLEEPINRHGAAVVFHGHAHHGQPEGRTQTGIPVYNVSRSLLAAAGPDQPPVRIHVLS